MNKVSRLSTINKEINGFYDKKPISNNDIDFDLHLLRKRAMEAVSSNTNKKIKLNESNGCVQTLEEKDIELIPDFSENRENFIKKEQIIENKGAKVSQPPSSKGLANQKRKNTLKEKVQNSQSPRPLSESEDKLEFNYKHTIKGDVTIQTAISFGKSTKTEFNTYLQKKELPFGEHLGLYYTPQTPCSPVKGTKLPIRIFEIRKGNDVVIDQIITENNTIRPARIDTPYKDIGNNADIVVNNLLKRGQYQDLKVARKRLARDIQRVGRGLKIETKYTREEWDILSEFAAVIKLDKARAPRATQYINEVLTDTEHSFTDRFGSFNPIYKGTGKGYIEIEKRKVVRGAEALRTVADLTENSEDTDYGSDMEIVPETL